VRPADHHDAIDLQDLHDDLTIRRIMLHPIIAWLVGWVVLSPFAGVLLLSLTEVLRFELRGVALVA
jgi:hypothetical protein